jgi:hypothetical protein
MLSPLRNRAGKRLREPFGKAGLTVAVIALVFAMLGGAYAAGGLTSKQKKEVKAIAKSFQGTGPAGAAGPAGPQGPAGAKGDSGAGGKEGISPIGTAFSGNEKGCSEGGVEFKGANTTVACNGKKGNNGTAGKSVVVEEEATGTGNCAGLGGSSFEQQGSATKTYACNGKEGSPWTAGGTLPSGKTETGAWGFRSDVQKITTEVEGVKSEVTVGATNVDLPISFPIPLLAPIANANVHIHLVEYPTGATAEEIEQCPGSAEEPKAKAGHLCIYTGANQNGGAPLAVTKGGASGYTNPSKGVSTAGGVLNVLAEVGTRIKGTWAVTAP